MSFGDVLPEFGARVLDLIQQPLEYKIVSISPAEDTLTFPANFTLVAAMDPWACGSQVRHWN